MEGVTTDPMRVLQALELLGATTPMMASEAKAPVVEVLGWLGGKAIPEDSLARLRVAAVAYIHFNSKRQSDLLIEIPTVLENRTFRDELDRLNQAHWLLYGEFFLEWVRRHELPEGRADGP